MRQGAVYQIFLPRLDFSMLIHSRNKTLFFGPQKRTLRGHVVSTFDKSALLWMFSITNILWIRPTPKF